MVHNKLIIFEGCDRSGKSSLRLELLKKIPNILTIDRLMASNYVYAKYFNRKEDFEYLRYLDSVLSMRGIIVYCYCDYKTYLKRCKDTKHEIFSEKEYNLQRKLYDIYLDEETSFNVLNLNTGKYTIKECVKILIEYIKERK